MAVSTAVLLDRLEGSKDFRVFMNESGSDFEKRSLPIILNKLCAEREMYPATIQAVPIHL